MTASPTPMVRGLRRSGAGGRGRVDDSGGGNGQSMSSFVSDFIPFRRWRVIMTWLMILTIVGSIGMSIGYWETGNLPFSTRTRTSQFYGLLNSSPLESYADVLAIGHNSGESAYTIKRALSYGADVIEIDVALQEGRLVSAHDSPQGWRSRIFRGLSLEEAWNLSTNASIIQLDLKEHSPAYQRKVFEFIESHQDGPPILVSTRDPVTLWNLQERYPDVLRFLSVADRVSLELLLQSPDLADMLNGVTVRHTLLDEDTVERLDEFGLTIIAWTVNDLERVNALVKLGVNGITTDNLAILELIRDQRKAADVTGN
jgi:glycerophosphoryl diester phosphodiesterase